MLHRDGVLVVPGKAGDARVTQWRSAILLPEHCPPQVHPEKGCTPSTQWSTAAPLLAFAEGSLKELMCGF